MEALPYVPAFFRAAYLYFKHFRLHELGAQRVNFGIVNTPENAFLEAYPGLPPITSIHPTKPVSGWTGVRPTEERAFQNHSCAQSQVVALQKQHDFKSFAIQ